MMKNSSCCTISTLQKALTFPTGITRPLNSTACPAMSVKPNFTFNKNDVYDLKGLCQLESMRSEVMQITFNCQNSIVFNA